MRNTLYVSPMGNRVCVVILGYAPQSVYMVLAPDSVSGEPYRDLIGSGAQHEAVPWNDVRVI